MSGDPSAEAILTQHSHALHEHFKQLFARYTAPAGSADLPSGSSSPSYLRPDAPPRLMEAIGYSVYAGGKRLRPALILESCRACGGSNSAMQHALTAAAAMELIHTFSLVHDDLPAMDNDDLRRGRPTNHKVFGEALAILAGDAMTTMAFEILATEIPSPLCARLTRELASGSGPCGMIGGQVLDMEGEGRKLSLEELQRLHRMKTGALLTASCRLGALCAGSDEARLSHLTTFGAQLGMAFQIVDDVLDETSTAEVMGKAVKKDAAKGKNTYPVLLGLEGSRAAAAQALSVAMDAIASLGAPAELLRAIARFVVERSH